MDAFSKPYIPSAHQYSDSQFEIIRRYIMDFQRSLDSSHDIGLMLTNFGQSVLMEVTEIGFERPVLMVFRGFVNGQMSVLIQHVSQINFLLATVPNPIEEPKRKIGFTVS